MEIKFPRLMGANGNFKKNGKMNLNACCLKMAVLCKICGKYLHFADSNLKIVWGFQEPFKIEKFKIQ